MSSTIRINQYTLLQIDCNEKYGWSITEGFESKKDGEFAVSVCKRRFGKDKPEVTAPVSIKLGNRESAIAALKMFLAEVEEFGGFDIPKSKPDVEDVPF